MLSGFGAQLAEHIPRLRRYARALTGERSAADDLVQDALERACNKRHLWRRDSDLRAWLLSIMHNVFVNQLRGRRPPPVLSLAGEGEQAWAGFASESTSELATHSTPADRLTIRDLDAALARLPDEQREVLLLVALEQLSYEETAKTLGIPIGTVMSRLSRARERLRVLMAGGGSAPAATTLRVVR
ncbi:RNA polymerase sigma factor [Candidatus Accumulibacter sp. ACC003]|uniref:RNA polymerase sigma factor n=1 Tax=Candidatus Accumulibacter sp. ACC003 TaxID=2823334 RepID=UPI0025BF0563|nr:RNA polymerase sigma factor [Candidatus Accumulibacter sp. ACC003]